MKKLCFMISCACICTSLSAAITLNEKLYKQLVQQGLLYRPFVFYDVMGIFEKDFDVNNSPILTFIKQNQKDPSADMVKNVLSSYNAELDEYPRRAALLGTAFSVKTVADLRKEWGLNKVIADQPGSIQLVDGYVWKQQGDIKTALQQTDIIYLQEQHPGAVFQIASNFDCLEGGMFSATTRLEEMQHQAVQGENASLATIGGAILRKYAFDRVNLLEKLSNKIKVAPKQGKNFSHLEADVKKQLDDQDIDKIAVGIHQDVVVTSGYVPPYVQPIDKNDQHKAYIDYLMDQKIVAQGRDPLYVFNKYIKQNNWHRIDQIFTSGLNICKHKNDATWEESAKVILKGMYLGTFLAAAVLGKQELYLTLVGGSAFCNDIQWILAALDQQEIRDIIHDAGINVFLVLYPDIRVGRGLDDTTLKLIRTTVAKMDQKIQRELKDHVDVLAMALDKLK